MRYGKHPRFVAEIKAQPKEMMFYQDIPISLSGQATLAIEPRIGNSFGGIIGAACCDFVGVFGLDRFVQSNIYVCAKYLWQEQGTSYNRQGWHTDGFGTEDINYIWSDCNSTIFNDSDFDLSQDDERSMEQMQYQATANNDFHYPDNTLLQLDQYAVHKVVEQTKGMRAFVKITFSKDKFDLKGNARNYGLDYNWEMRERSTDRNIPQLLRS